MTKALIMGGGIAGAVTAMAFRQAGIEPVVHEAYPTGADDIGAFLTIMKNGMNALRAVEAHQPVIDASFPATDVEYIDGTGAMLGLNPMRGDAHTVRRAALYRVLHDEAARRGIPLSTANVWYRPLKRTARRSPSSKTAPQPRQICWSERTASTQRCGR